MVIGSDKNIMVIFKRLHKIIITRITITICKTKNKTKILSRTVRFISFHSEIGWYGEFGAVLLV